MERYTAYMLTLAHTDVYDDLVDYIPENIPA
jgi:hypothetical protein